MALATGRRLGPYEILSPLGAGGMGEVYVARDTRLDRRVAVKVLAPEHAVDAAHLARFAREARAASSLNHPNIVGVLDVGVDDETSWVTMELVEGKTLAELLHMGPLSTRRLLEFACQLAEGLAAAHEAGIVHRDLKPSNVMVTREGFVKILDFGLARTPRERVEGAISTAQTVPPTETGEIVGTAGYMSPEQARGEKVDFRSDQFSFGSVVYEMATGRRAFRGDTRIDTLVAVLNQDPEPITRFAPGVPPPLRWAIERCHAKSAAERYQSTRDLARELRGIRDHLSEVSGSLPEEPSAPRRRRSRWSIALTAGAVVAALVWALLRGLRPAPAAPDFRQLTFRNGVVARAFFMQKSNSILYTASWDGRTYQTYLTLPESKGADRSLDAGSQLPMAFSEDGSEVLVLLGRSRPAINSFGTLAWWPALGGKPRPFLEHSGWADWAKRSRFAAAVHDEGDSRTLQVRDSSGNLVRELFRTAGAIAYVAISPDEREVAFIHHPTRFDDAGEIWVASLDGRTRRAVTRVFERCSGLRWNPRSGEVWFTASRSDIYSTSLWAVDRRAKVRLIHSFPDLFVLQDIGDAGCLFLASSEDTRLLVRKSDDSVSDFSWLGSTFVTDIAPDGRSILFLDGSAGAGTLGAWVRPLDGSEAIRIADADPGKFSPDGRLIVATSRLPSGPPQLVLVPVGGGSPRALTSSASVSYSDPSFAGAETLLYVRSEGQRREVGRMRVDGSRPENLGVSACAAPAGDAAATRFVCIAEPGRGALTVHALQPGGASSTLYTLPEGEAFLYTRWSAAGDRIFAVTDLRRLLTVDASRGVLLREQSVPVRGDDPAGSLLTAACGPDCAAQAYSISHTSSRLYLGRGLF